MARKFLLRVALKSIRLDGLPKLTAINEVHRGEHYIPSAFVIAPATCSIYGNHPESSHSEP